MKTIQINRIIISLIFWAITLTVSAAMSSQVVYTTPDSLCGKFTLSQSDCTQRGWAYYFEVKIPVSSSIPIKIGCDFNPTVYAQIYSGSNYAIDTEGQFTGTTVIYLTNGKLQIFIAETELFFNAPPRSFSFKFVAGSYATPEDSYIRGNSVIDGNLSVGTLSSGGKIAVSNVDKPYSIYSTNYFQSVNPTFGLYSELYNNSGPVYGVYSGVYGGSSNQRYSGYFTGGDVDINGGNLKVYGGSVGGKVGIGTYTAPTQALSVTGRIAVSASGTTSDEAYNGALMITKPSASGQYVNLVRQGQTRWSIGTVYNSNTFAIGQGTTSDASFTNSFFNITNGGNVGIGTTAPKSKLESVSGVNAYPATAGTAQTGSALRLRGGDDTVLDFGMNSTNTWIQATNQSHLAQKYNISLNPNGGNVGIGTGTVAPGAKLDVAGEVRSAGVNAGFRVCSGLGDNINQAPWYGIGQSNLMLSTYTGAVQLAGFYGLNFQTAQGQMVMLENGKVGIGTTTPDVALTVKGSIHANEIIVDVLAPIVPDFVFHPTYSLMPLHEVEQYVKTNSHLPEIPSAAEISKNGMSIGEMQNKLLQKIEELTLYVIEQDKKIERLEKAQK